MAKKTAVKVNEEAQGGYPNAIEIPLSACFLSDVNSRGDKSRDAERVEQIATSMIERRSSGKYHQMVPAIVRSADGDRFEVLDGGYRFEAATQAEQAAGEPFPLWAVVVRRGDDVEALIESIQANEFRQAPTEFERAEMVERLLAAGKKQVEVASIFGLSEGSISQIAKLKTVAKDKKLRKLIEDGTVERDAAILIAQMEPDDTKRAELIEECLRHKNKVETLASNYETRKAKAKLDAEAEEAKTRAEKAKEEAKAAETKRKELEKEKDEIVKQAAKTKTVSEMEKLRAAEEAKSAEIEQLAAEEKERLAEVEKAKKEREKIANQKQKLSEAAKPKSGKVTAEDVKQTAKAKGTPVGKNNSEGGNISRRAFIAGLEAVGNDKELSPAVGNLIGKIEAYFDGEIGDKALKDAFMLYCKNADQYAAVAKGKKAAAGRK